MSEVLAAIDVGTNSIHMVVARVVDGDRFDVIAREKAQVRLGHGAGDMKRLDDDAVERSIEVLGRFRRLADAHGAQVRAVATSAVREAEDHDTFLGRARREAGTDVEVISGAEEARLIHLGVMSGLSLGTERALLFDIGGGSTELVLSDEGEIVAARSVKVGAVRLTHRYLASEQPSKGDIEACRRHIHGELVAFQPAVRKHGFDIAVGSSGTIEQLVRLACLRSGDDPPQRTWNGARASAESLREVIDDLLRRSRKGAVAELEGLDPKRVDIITAGALVVEAILDRFSVPEVVLSEAALREGVLIDTLERVRGGALRRVSDVAGRSVGHLASAFDDDPAHSAWVATLALQVFDDLAERLDLPASARGHLEAAARLANVGLAVSHSGHHKHSYYLIRHSDRLVGLTDAEIERIALVARYHRKSAPKESHPEFARLGADERAVVRKLAAVLRLAIGLDRSHARRVAKVEVIEGTDGLVVELTPTVGEEIDLELHSTSERAALLAEVLGVEIAVRSAGDP